GLATTRRAAKHAADGIVAGRAADSRGAGAALCRRVLHDAYPGALCLPAGGLWAGARHRWARDCAAPVDAAVDSDLCGTTGYLPHDIALAEPAAALIDAGRCDDAGTRCQRAAAGKCDRPRKLSAGGCGGL